MIVENCFDCKNLVPIERDPSMHKCLIQGLITNEKDCPDFDPTWEAIHREERATHNED